MRITNLFTKTTKQITKDEVSRNAELLIKAGFVDKLLSGVYTYLPLGLRTLEKIKNIIREEMNEIGAQEILMPALTPYENWETTGRQEMDVLFHLEGVGGKKYVLGATHEEVVTPLVQKFVKSYKDLPVAVYQMQNKFRNEARAKSGLLRGREFSMKDLYNFHYDEKEFDKFYDKATEAYFKIYNKLGIGDITVLTYASGGAFSKYSHEFQTISDIGEDEIYLCEKCRVAINKEIIDEGKKCPKCGNEDLVMKNSIEVGNIFKLKNKFSSPFNFQVAGESGEMKDLFMGCYGMGPSRIMGTLVEIFNDDKGIIWPESVAPYQVHLVTLGQDQAVISKAEKLYKELKDKGVEVLFDDRLSASAGEKLADADLIGLPLRVLLSEKTLKLESVEMKKRNESEAQIILIKDLLEKVI